VLDKRYPEARAEFESILKRFQNDADAIYAVGLLAFLVKEYAVAESNMKRLLDLGYRDANAVRYTLGQIAEEQKDWAQAIEWYKAIPRGEYAMPARMRTAHAIAKQGRLDEARSFLRRVGADHPGEQVQLLVENHLLMNYTAQRRDINEKKVIAEFAKTVSTVENLRLLYLITYADLRAVGPDVWTIWKGALLWEIYHKALDVLEGAEEEETSIEEQVARIKEEVVLRLAPEVGREAVEDFFRAMPYKYILSMPAETITRHVRLTTSLGDDKLRIHYTHNDEVRYSELMVSTIGKAGVFSKIAGTLTSKNINILGAQIYTRNDGIAVDTLQVESLERTPIYDERVWESIRKDLLAILEGEKQVEDLLANRQRSGPFRREPAIAVPVRIELDNRTSDTHTVIEVICPDLMGNLYRITNVLYHLGIDIYLAKISTEADRAINVFYVTDLAGMKIVGEEKIQPLREEIRAALMPSPA